MAVPTFVLVWLLLLSSVSGERGSCSELEGLPSSDGGLSNLALCRPAAADLRRGSGPPPGGGRR